MGKFFYTSEDRLHGARVAFLIYCFGLAIGWKYNSEWMRVMRSLFIAGWWFAFCQKRPAHSLAELVREPATIVGAVMAVAGLVGEFYLIYHPMP